MFKCNVKPIDGEFDYISCRLSKLVSQHAHVLYVISKFWKKKDMGEPEDLLGISIVRSSPSLNNAHQSAYMLYIRDMLYIYAVYICCICCIYAVYAVYMLYICCIYDVYAVYMLYMLYICCICCIYAVYMLYICCIYAVYKLYICCICMYIHEACMSHLQRQALVCRTPVVATWFDLLQTELALSRHSGELAPSVPPGRGEHSRNPEWEAIAQIAQHPCLDDVAAPLKRCETVAWPHTHDSDSHDSALQEP